MPSDHVLQLCSSTETVIAAVAAAPHEEISKVAKRLFKSHSSAVTAQAHVGADEHDASDLDKAAKCGKFPYRPSDLFLKIYNDVLNTLDKDPLANLVSPSLMGSSGVIPLSVVSVIPDIMRHYADLIVRAQTEVFIATNYWEPSHSAGIISDSLRELSKRVQSRKGQKVVVKLMYDRGTPSQIVKNHAFVKSDAWGKVGLPEQNEISGIDLEVVNYHRPVLGTFHAKYLIVDRKVACLNSNNIQDRPNVEMMIHLEGPIVDGFYDMALLSWSNSLNPPLPLLSKPPVHPDTYRFHHDNEYLEYIDPDFTSKETQKFLHKQQAIGETEADGAGQGPSGRVKNAFHLPDGGGPDEKDSARKDLISEHPNMTVPSDQPPNSKASENSEAPADSSAAADTPAETDLDQNDAEDVTRARESDGRIVDGQDSGGNRVAGITAHLNAGNMELDATVEDNDSMLDFRPHILHKAHNPCPIAMVNRRPSGTPGHHHDVPQDVAWISAMKYAKQSVFIQTPTFNATPMISATCDTCRRGVQVTLYLDLGFNDQGEMIPFQGGTNEEVVNKMYKTLNSEGKQDNLKVYWYTSKDQRKPLSAAAKKRNCHVKFMAIDDQVAILGNGNQDTQSWFHSQEINVMVDSKELVAEWIKGINANQNTRQFGLVDDADGVWRDQDGSIVEASGTKNAGPFGHLKGIGGAIARVRGTGGF